MPEDEFRETVGNCGRMFYAGLPVYETRKRMFLASKVACAGIVLLLLTTGISGTRPTPITSRPDLGNEVPALADPKDVNKMQQILQDEGRYRGKVDGVLGLRTRASIRGFQKAENLPVTGELDVQTADKLGVRPEVREEKGYETPLDKPSAGIKGSNRARRTSKTPRMSVKKSAPTVPPA
jgi:hypothetical protein